MNAHTHNRIITALLVALVVLLALFAAVALHATLQEDSAARTPAVCLRALTLAEQGLTASGDALTAGAQLDQEGVDAAGARLDSLAPRYRAAAAACRADR